ncbi:MAG: hypothetical protein ABJE10_18285 [bacterium]
MLFHVLVAVSMAGITWAAGWWGVALLALILGFVYRNESGRAWRVALGASEGWALLLIVDMVLGPLGHVARTLGGAMSIPAPALVLVTLLFPALLAWGSAALAAELGALARNRGAEAIVVPPAR